MLFNFLLVDKVIITLSCPLTSLFPRIKKGKLIFNKVDKFFTINNDILINKSKVLCDLGKEKKSLV